MYSTVFIFLILGGLGFPIPEEFPLIIGGMAAASATASIQLMFVVCYLGVLIGDQTMYLFGRLFGHKLLRAGTKSSLFPSITEERVNEVREGLRKKRLLYLFIGRHFFFLRSVTFLVAGSLRVPFFEFLAADAAAALCSVGIFVGLGYFVGNQIAPEVITKIAHQATFYLVIALCLGAVVYLLFVKPAQQKQALVKDEADPA